MNVSKVFKIVKNMIYMEIVRNVKINMNLKKINAN